MGIGGSGETAEGHVIRYFGKGKGVAETGTRQAWQGRGRGGGGVTDRDVYGRGTGVSVCWDGDM